MGKVQKRSSVDLNIFKLNETYLYIDADRSFLRDLNDRYKFLIKNHKFHPKVKNKIWDGYIRLFNLNSQTIYVGLLRNIIEYCDMFDLTYKINFKYNKYYNDEYIESVIDDMTDDDFRFDGARSYQKDAFVHGISHTRSIMTSATASGKSIILYLISMYYTVFYDKKVLIIVPSKSLVEQMYGDFIEYHKGEKEQFSNVIQRVHSQVSSVEKEKDFGIVVTTYQSAVKRDKEWFDNFDVLLGDEVHEWEAKSLVDIIDKCDGIEIRHGFTGTLKTDEESNTNSLALVGMFGPVKSISKTYELVEAGILPPSNIYCFNIKYKDKELKKKFKSKKKMPDGTYKSVPLEWAKELSTIFEIDIRTRFITNMALASKGNSLVMFNTKEEQGKKLYDMLKENSINKDIFYIDGDVHVDDRTSIIKHMETNDNCVLVASYGTFKRGINLKNLHNIFIPMGFKASTTVLQTLGRGLRGHTNKTHLNVFDFGDNITGSNHSFNHFKKRIQLYKREKHKVKVISYDLANNKLIKSDGKK